MSLESICKVPVLDLVAPSSNLFLWVPAGLNRAGIGMKVANAWGYSVVSEIIWDKPNLGVGAFPRLCHEVLLVCRHGRVPFSGPRNIRSVQTWRQNYGNNGGKWHSAKPAGAYQLIESVSPGPYLELFARQTRMGWDVLEQDFAVVLAQSAECGP